MTDTIVIQPYGYLSITPGETVAVTAGNVPNVYLKTGSDAIRLPMGHCVMPKSNFVALVNPYPREAVMNLSRGLEVNVTHEAGPNVYQTENIESFGAWYRPAEVTGRKWAVGLMMKRGSLSVEFLDGFNDGFTQVMIFPGADPDFLDFKPVGAMEAGNFIRRTDGEAESDILCVSGTYTDADVAAWISASGYSGQVTVGHFSQVFVGRGRWTCDKHTALFFVRAADKIVNMAVKVTHLGAKVEEFM